MENNNKHIIKIRSYLALFWSIYSACYMTAVTFVPIDSRNESYAQTILGFILGTVVGAIISYYLGSSYEGEKELRRAGQEEAANEIESNS